MSKQANEITQQLFNAAGFVNHGTLDQPRYRLTVTEARRVVRVERHCSDWIAAVYRTDGGAKPVGAPQWQAKLGPLPGSAVLMIVGVVMHANGVTMPDPVGPAMRGLVLGAQQATLALAEKADPVPA